MLCVFFLYVWYSDTPGRLLQTTVLPLKLKHYDEKIERSFYFEAFSVAYQ